MDMQTPSRSFDEQPALEQRSSGAKEGSSSERGGISVEMNDRIKALQDRYAKARGPEPRAFATRFRD